MISSRSFVQLGATVVTAAAAAAAAAAAGGGGGGAAAATAAASSGGSTVTSRRLCSGGSLRGSEFSRRVSSVAQTSKLQLSSYLVDSNTTAVPCSSTKPVEQLSHCGWSDATPVHPTKFSALPKRGRGQHFIPINTPMPRSRLGLQPSRQYSTEKTRP
ncbi:unnamed protein product [Closterium sp. NIES-54]